MPRLEDDHRFERDRARFRRREPGAGLALPPELQAWLRGQEYACLMDGTNLGTAFIIKAPRPEIEGVRGPTPIELRHEVYDHPNAPVVREVLRLHDQPDSSLVLESFTNVADPLQRADLARLSTQRLFYLFFYDEAVRHQLTKAVPITHPELIAEALTVADLLLLGIPPDQFDFDRAKADVQRRHSL